MRGTVVKRLRRQVNTEFPMIPKNEQRIIYRRLKNKYNSKEG